MPKNEDGLAGSGEVHLQVVAGVFLGMKSRSAADFPEFFRQMPAKSVECRLVVAGRFQFNQLAKAGDDPGFLRG